MVCITNRSSFTVNSSNQLSLVNPFPLMGSCWRKYKKSFLSFPWPWRRLSVSNLWQLKPFIVSFGFHTLIMIFQKIVDAIHRFTKTEDFLMSLSVTIQGKLLEYIKKSDEKASNFAKIEKNKKNLSCYVKRIPLLDLFSKSIFYFAIFVTRCCCFYDFCENCWLFEALLDHFSF